MGAKLSVQLDKQQTVMIAVNKKLNLKNLKFRSEQGSFADSETSPNEKNLKLTMYESNLIL